MFVDDKSKKRWWIRIFFLVVMMIFVWFIVNFIAVHVLVQDSFFMLGLQYISNGLLICVIAALVTFFFLNWIFLTIDNYFDTGEFVKDWRNIKPEVRVCVSMYIVSILFLSLVLAFKP